MGIYKGVFPEDITYQHRSFVNNLNKNHYFTNHSTYNISVSTKVPRDSKTDILINNLNKDFGFPNSEIAPLSADTHKM